MKTVLVDRDTVYDLNITNDRFLLGFKGEMSSMELCLLRERSQAAIQEKARRGELYLTVPAAYIKTPNNHLKKNPDKRIQEVIHLVFSKFREYGTMRSVYNWFVNETIEVPMISNGRGVRTSEWKLPKESTILRILDNPIYAGAYAYGRTKTEVYFEDGRKRLRKGVRKDQNDWDVLILDHHDGYITWQEYQSNMNTLAQNANQKRPLVKGAVGNGEALLSGFLRCGHCGRKLLTKYQGRNGTHKRYVCTGKRIDNDPKGCISFGGSRVDQTVTEFLFKVLSPIGLEASLKAIEKINIESGTIRRQRELELEEARYEALLAQRRYNAVDPDNRLVASTLENDWNDTLIKIAKLESQIDGLVESPSALSPEEEAEVKDLSQDLPLVWNHPSSSAELKKRIIRTVIKEIIVYLKDQKVTLVIHWQGGEHTELEIVKNKSTNNPLRTDVGTKQIICELARIMPDKQIVAFLNRLGKTTAQGHTWNPVRLRAFRSHNKIRAYRQGERQERGEFSVNEASLKLGIGNTKVWRLIHHKILPAKQVCAGAPWIILKEDLETEAVKKMAHSKLPKRPPSLDHEQQLFDFQ